MLAEATSPAAIDGVVGIFSRLFAGATGPSGVAIGAVIVWLVYDVATKWIDRRNGTDSPPVVATVEAVRSQVVAINEAHLGTLEDHETRLRAVERELAEHRGAAREITGRRQR